MSSHKNFSLLVTVRIEYCVNLVWSNEIVTTAINRPKVSDESQFHHPPHVPSCKAHQLPIHKDVKLMTQEIQLIGSTKLMRGDRINKGALFKTAEIDKKKQENAIARLE